MRLINDKNKLLSTPDSRYAPNCAIAATSVLAMLVPFCLPPCLIFGLSLVLPYIIHSLIPGYAGWMAIPIAIPIAAILMTGYFLAGRAYIAIFSHYGFGSRKEVLEPLFRASAIAFGLIAGFSVLFAVSLPYAVSILSALCCSGGLAFFLLGQKHQMRKVVDSLSDHDPRASIEDVTSSGEFIDRMFALKEAENIEHLEQLSKQCLTILKPAAGSSIDCTSKLIDELMKNKLHTEADELSSLQLKLIDQEAS